MYRWWVFVHLAGVFGFLAAHGVSMAVTFKLRSERDPRKVSDLLVLSGSSIRAFYASLSLLLTGGIVAGFLGNWWSRAWIWTSIGILIATSLAMYALARPYYRRVGLVARALADGSKAVTDEQFDSILRTRRPIAIAVIGFGGLIAILYLMMFKPSLGFGEGLPQFSPGGRAAEDCAPSGSALQIVAQNNQFDTDCLAAPSGRAFTIALDNRDGGVPHNVAIYRDPSASASLFVGSIFGGPRTETYRIDSLPAGRYYFRCDVHPQMEGRLVVG